MALLGAVLLLPPGWSAVALVMVAACGGAGNGPAFAGITAPASARIGYVAVVAARARARRGSLTADGLRAALLLALALLWWLAALPGWSCCAARQVRRRVAAVAGFAVLVPAAIGARPAGAHCDGRAGTELLLFLLC